MRTTIQRPPPQYSHHYTVWCDRMGTVFAQMSPRTAFTRHEYNILYQMYNSQYNQHFSTTKTQFHEFLVVMCFITLKIHILLIHLKFKKFKIKFPKYSIFMFFLKCPLHHCVCNVKAVQEDIYAKTIPIWLHHTV